MVTRDASNNAHLGRCRFGRRLRLRKPGEFRRVFAAKCSTADNYLIIYAASNKLGHARLGISAGRRLGPAVRRNRYKRVVRESFRRLQHELPQGYDYVVIPRKREVVHNRDITMEQYLQSLAGLCRRVVRRCKQRNEDRNPS